MLRLNTPEEGLDATVFDVIKSNLLPLTLPLLLCNSGEPIDFVLNAAATFFILDLDDIDG